MPLVRAQVRNEYGLGQPELYKEVNREDPKAVLDSIAVAGLVGILRQLGDLAEFAAEVFHGLQEQVMSTASRSHKLTIRVQRIEAALPPLEKAVLAQTSHIHFAYTAGSEWHPRIRNEKNLFIYNDLPRFIMDSYEYVVLDSSYFCFAFRFDAGGPGSCLQRYSDPTFFKRASGSSIEEDIEKVPTDKRTRKSKKRRSSHRNGKLSRGASLSSCSGRMQFTSVLANGRASSQNASTVDMALKSDIGEHSSSFDSRTGSGYIECAFNLGSSMLEELEPKEFSSKLMQETNTLGSNFPVDQTRVLDDNFSHSSSQEQIVPSSSCVTWDEKAEIVESKAGNRDIYEVPEMNFDVDVQEIGIANARNGDQVHIPFNDVDAPQASIIENQNDEIESEPDNYMDALNTIESESENDIECHRKQEVEQCSENDIECQRELGLERSEDANNVSNENREDEEVVMDDNVDSNSSIIEPSASSYIISSNGMSGSSSDPVASENIPCEQVPQISGKSSDPDRTSNTGLCISEEICNGSQAEFIISDPSPSSGSTVSDMHDPASDRIMNSVNDSQNSQTESSSVHSVGFWTNGGLLGLQPSKPPDFAVSTVGQGSAATTSEVFGPPNQILMSLQDGLKGNAGTVVENANLDANLGRPVNSHFNDNLDNLNGVGSILNTSLPHGNKNPVNPNIKATSIDSDEEDDDKSSRMFGLGHKLLVNGFRRKVSIGNDDDSEPATSTKTGVLEPRNEQQCISYQKIPQTTVNEQIGNGSPINSLTSSPPLEHMKISFNPLDGFGTSKLKLQFPDGNHYHENIRDMFPSFQLVPVPAISAHGVASDSDDDTFCRSSPYMSDYCLSHCSESNSEQWESGEAPESNDPALYDALSRLSSMESVSSCLQVGGAANNGICVNGGNKKHIAPGSSAAEPSLSMPLDLPGFDVINPVLHDETKSNSDQKNQVKLQNATQLKPLPPPPPPCTMAERQHALSESLRHELDLKLLSSFVSQKPEPPLVNQQEINDKANALKPEKKVDEEKNNGQEGVSLLSGGGGMDEKEDFLHQIRTKSFNLRPTATARPTVISGPTANVQVTAILQKANAIRQAVGSDDDDNWSDN
ncbi:hypothetical protein V6Z11_A05G164400 [Gossypium hirsutum]